MTETVSIRDLRHHGGDVVDRVGHSGPVTVTRDGMPVAVIVPVPAAALSAAEVVRRARHLPDLDPASLRRDIDDLLDQTI